MPLKKKLLFIALKRPIKGFCQPLSDYRHIIFLMSNSYYCVTRISCKIGQGLSLMWRITNQQPVFLFSWKNYKAFPYLGVPNHQDTFYSLSISNVLQGTPLQGNPLQFIFIPNELSYHTIYNISLEPVVEDIRMSESQ